MLGDGAQFQFWFANPLGFLLALSLSFIIGFEREEVKDEGGPGFFGGVRTFPLIGLSGFVLVTIFPDNGIPFAVGLLAVAGLLFVSHWASLQKAKHPGITTEVAALLTYALGGISARGYYGVATGVGAVAVLILHEKERLEGLVKKVSRRELGTAIRFVVLAGAILPALPNKPLTRFGVNPFKIWLVVVAVSGVSYFGYLVRMKYGGKKGVFLTGVLGGAYSSTATTVSLARQGRREGLPSRVVAGAILAATAVMYPRVLLLLEFFAGAVARVFVVPFLATSLVALCVAALLVKKAQRVEETGEVTRNPLELLSALSFGALFLGLYVVTRVVSEKFGSSGMVILGTFAGVLDVDPFVIGAAQQAAQAELARSPMVMGILAAVSANNVAKGVYAYIYGGKRLGLISLALLAGAALFCVLATLFYLRLLP